MHSAWVYILTNEHNHVLYVGMTTELPTRLWEHRTKRNPNCFTARYNLGKLVYYEGHELIVDAITREKYMKGKSHKWKVQLIESLNPDWEDLTSRVSRQKEIPLPAS
jgi:putative endonuclease